MMSATINKKVVMSDEALILKWAHHWVGAKYKKTWAKRHYSGRSSCKQSYAGECHAVLVLLATSMPNDISDTAMQ